MLHRIRFGLAAAACLMAVTTAFAADPFVRGPENRFWEPMKDTVYLQESGRQVHTQSPVTSVAVVNDSLYAVTNEALYVLRGDALVAVSGAPAAVRRITAPDGRLWVLSGQGLYRLDDGWTRLDEREFVDVILHNGELHAATAMDVFRIEDGAFVPIEPEGGYRSTNITYNMEDGTQILPRPVTFGPLRRIASYSETIYALRNRDIALFDGEHIDSNITDYGQLPSRELRDFARLGNRLFIATDRGVAELRGMSVLTITGEDGLPYEDTTCLAPGFDRDLWIGTTRGAIRMTRDGEFHYFAGQRWVPGEHVHGIAAGRNAVYLATNNGLGIVEYEPYTLRKKADYYERWLEEWGQKRLGFTHLIWYNEAEGGWIREITDNDGGYSSHYLVAMVFKYAVTGDERDRREAVDAFEGLVWLESITPVEGLLARSIWSVEGDAGSQGQHGSGGLPAKWTRTGDGLWEWKGDVSSDEVGAHYYAASLFHDLAAKGAEKERAKEHLRRVTNHIIDNGWKVVDPDGEPTRWGRWDPEYLQRPYGMYARGLNGMEAQAYAMTAYAITGDPKFKAGYDQLIAWRYHDHTVRQKLTFPPDYITPWDDRLGFMSLFPLLKYTEDPHLRSIYARSLERSWAIKRNEHVAWYNFIYGAATGNDYEAEAAVRHLREWPLDLRNFSYQNSHRHDLHLKPGYRHDAEGPRTPAPMGFSPRDIGPRKLDSTWLGPDGGGGGRGAVTPNAWLESYWMARYFGMITAPETRDRNLISVPRRNLQLGAEPYDGPPRPKNP